MANGWLDMANDRDASGDLTPLAQALDCIGGTGCDCGVDEPGSCIGCVCESALKWQWQAGKEARAFLAELCSAIETHPLDRTNEYVENARKRARDFLEANEAKAPACASCERANCDADATGKCPITGEEGDHLL
jgi:hypothetical protein